MKYNDLIFFLERDKLTFHFPLFLYLCHKLLLTKWIVSPLCNQIICAERALRKYRTKQAESQELWTLSVSSHPKEAYMRNVWTQGGKTGTNKLLRNVVSSILTMDKEKILTRLRGVVPQIFKFLESCSSELVGALDMSSNFLIKRHASCLNQPTCFIQWLSSKFNSFIQTENTSKITVM